MSSHCHLPLKVASGRTSTRPAPGVSLTVRVGSLVRFEKLDALIADMESWSGNPGGIFLRPNTKKCSAKKCSIRFYASHSIAQTRRTLETVASPPFVKSPSTGSSTLYHPSPSSKKQSCPVRIRLSSRSCPNAFSGRKISHDADFAGSPPSPLRLSS